MNFKLLFSTSLLFGVLLTGCFCHKSDDEPDPRNCDNCIGMMCTEDFRMVTIHLKNEDGSPIILDKYELFYTTSGRAVERYEDSELSKQGLYIIATDALMSNIDCEKGTSITFKAKINSKESINESFVIGKDCCHINLLENKETEYTF